MHSKLIGELSWAFCLEIIDRRNVKINESGVTRKEMIENIL